MKRAVYIIFSYCCLMTAAMAYMLVTDVTDVRNQERQLGISLSNQAKITEQAEAVQREFDELAREQRLHRQQLSGDSAITVSQAVQELNDNLTRLRHQEDQAKAAVTGNQDMLERMQLQFVPHIALLLLHALAIWLFWPWRVFSAEPRKKIQEWKPKM